MKEAYVTFDTAELLKEKNFDWECRSYYEYFSSDVTLFQGMLPELSEAASNFNNKGYDICSRPTQQMAMRWLREEKGIHICTVPDLSSDKFYVSIAVNVNGKWRLHANFPAPLLNEKYIKCEDAVEAALKYTLTKLI